MERPTGKKEKTQTPQEEAGVQKGTPKEGRMSGKKRPNQRSTLAKKHSKEPSLSPDDEEHV